MGIKIYAPEPVARRWPRRGYARYAGVIEPPRLDPRAHHRAVRRARAGHREGTVTVARERRGGGGRAVFGAAQSRVICRLIRVRPARRVCRYIRRIRRVGGDHHERAREHARELLGRVERAGDRRAVSGAVHKTLTRQYNCPYRNKKKRTWRGRRRRLYPRARGRRSGSSTCAPW